MDQVHVIRHKVLVEGVSIRAAAKELGVSRNTARRYLGDAAPTRPSSNRKRSVTDAARPRLHELLQEAPRWTGGKQRLTSQRLHEMLVAEGHEISPRSVRSEVAEWKRQRREVFVPLVYNPGELAEVDFFEVLVDVGGQRRKAWMFLLRLMHSGRDFAWIYPRQDQVCFLDGHVKAFAHLGAVPQRLIYDLSARQKRPGCALEKLTILGSPLDRWAQGARRPTASLRTRLDAGHRTWQKGASSSCNPPCRDPVRGKFGRQVAGRFFGPGQAEQLNARSVSYVEICLRSPVRL